MASLAEEVAAARLILPPTKLKDLDLPFCYRCGEQIITNALVIWGARAIYKRDRLGKYCIDLLFDRQSAIGAKENPDAWKELSAWIDDKAIKMIEDHSLSSDEDKEISFGHGKKMMIANPNGSYGYMYMTAWRSL